MKGKSNERGRPINDKRVAAFEAALRHPEDNDEVMTVKDLKQYMENALERTDESAYSERTIIRMLVKKFGDDFDIAKSNLNQKIRKLDYGSMAFSLFCFISFVSLYWITSPF